jgi:hypothetical protein
MSLSLYDKWLGKKQNMIRVSKIGRMRMLGGENRAYRNYLLCRVRLGVELGILVDWNCFVCRLRSMGWRKIWVMRQERDWLGVTYRVT